MMGDSLKARVGVSIEAEQIHDLDLDDPVRDIVAETGNDYNSALIPAVGSADVIWRKQLAFAPGVVLDFDLRTGHYNGGATQMQDGFGQHVTFQSVRALQVKTHSPSGPANVLYLGTQVFINPWKVLLPNFAVIPPYSGVAIVGDAALTLQSADEWGIDAGASFGGAFSLEANAGNTGDVVADITIIGIKP
jgi:hypothetical protein